MSAQLKRSSEEYSLSSLLTDVIGIFSRRLSLRGYASRSILTVICRTPLLETKQVSAAAYELEMEEQCGDMHYVMTNNEKFIKGKGCTCIAYHLGNGELVACFSQKKPKKSTTAAIQR